MKEVVLASNNQGKIKEFKRILEPLGFTVLSLSDIGFASDIVEDGASFFENALIKAKTIYEFKGIPTISDDSGLCVNYLDGAPGIHSARFCPGTDKDRRDYLLKELKDATDRSAYFHCSIIYYEGSENYHHFYGECNGTIGFEDHGEEGFGYDFIFYPDGYKCTFSELGLDEKNKISHRAVATKKFLEYLYDSNH